MFGQNFSSETTGMKNKQKFEFKYILTYRPSDSFIASDRPLMMTPLKITVCSKRFSVSSRR